MLHTFSLSRSFARTQRRLLTSMCLSTGLAAYGFLLPSTCTAQDAEPQDIVTTLRSAKSYTTFLLLADQAGLLPVLRGERRDSVRADIQFAGGSAFNKAMVAALGGNGDSIVIDLKPGESREMTLSEEKSKMLANAMTEDAKNQAKAEESFITVFAPNDAAFAKLSASTREMLTRDPKTRLAFVRMHIVNSGLAEDVLSDVVALPTLAETTLPVTKDGTTTLIGGVKVNPNAIIATNGYVYEIDTVLSTRPQR